MSRQNNMSDNPIENIKKNHKQKLWSYIKDLRTQVNDDDKAVAHIDGTREYTYSEVYNEWDRYARVFSGLNITQKNRSRVAIAGSITVEPLFCFFGLNMTGAEMSMFSYPDFLSSGKWREMIRHEKITDLIISDIMITPSLWKSIQNEREELGLRNVILLHSKMGGPAVGPAELIFNEFNYHSLKSRWGTVFMEDLLEKYKDTPISYGKFDSDAIGLISHTSGTTKGTRKPIIYNEIDLTFSILNDDRFKGKTIDGGMRSTMVVPLDFSSLQIFFGLFNSFVMGRIAVFTFFGFMHPKYIKAIEYYRAEENFNSGFIIDKWIERKDLDGLDLSSLKEIAFAGAYISDSTWEKYKKFYRDHGYRGPFLRIYGMSEVIGNVIINPTDRDIMGFPARKELIRIQDEKNKKFYKPEDGARTGILFMSGNAVARNILDGEKLFDYAVIDGKNYICTNDLVRIEKDGTMVYVGRADKYFVNNDNKRFDSGIVEHSLTNHPAIDRCAIVPVLEKRIHDTVPVLYVVPEKKVKGAEEDVRQALIDVYIRDKKINDDNIPVQFMIVDDVPINQNGKIDIFRITRERLLGDAYNIVPVREKGKLTDIKTEYVERLNSMVAAAPEGMGESSAFNIFELMN